MAKEEQVKKPRFVYEAEDWFDVFDRDGHRVFRGHPSDFFEEFDWWMNKLGLEVEVEGR